MTNRLLQILHLLGASLWIGGWGSCLRHTRRAGCCRGSRPTHSVVSRSTRGSSLFSRLRCSSSGSASAWAAFTNPGLALLRIYLNH